MNKKGFTLVEMLVVIAILSLLITLSVPTINKVAKNLYKTNKNQLTNAICSSVKEYVIENDLDLVKPEGSYNKNSCVYYSLDYILENDIYHTNTSKNNKLYVQNPETKKALTGGVKIYYIAKEYNNGKDYKIEIKAEYNEESNSNCNLTK